MVAPGRKDEFMDTFKKVFVFYFCPLSPTILCITNLSSRFVFFDLLFSFFF